MFYNYLIFGYNFFFKKFYLFFFFNRLIYSSKRFFYLTGSEKFESVFNNYKFFYNIRFGFRRYNYIIPLIFKNYEYINVKVPVFNIYFFLSFRIYLFKYLYNYLKYIFLFFFRFNYYYNFSFLMNFFFDKLNNKKIGKFQGKKKYRFVRLKLKKRNYFLRRLFFFSKNS